MKSVKKEAAKDKNQMEDKIDIKSEKSQIVNHVNKPNDAPPALNDDNNPNTSWHLESGDKINDYGN